VVGAFRCAAIAALQRGPDPVLENRGAATISSRPETGKTIGC